MIIDIITLLAILGVFIGLLAIGQSALANLETRIGGRIGEVKADLTASIGEVKADINKLDGRFYGLFQSHTDTRERVSKMSECLIRIESERLMLIDLKLDKLAKQQAGEQPATEQPEAEQSAA